MKSIFFRIWSPLLCLYIRFDHEEFIWVSSGFQILYFFLIFILIGKNLSRFSKDFKSFTLFSIFILIARIYLDFLRISNPLLCFYLPCGQQEFIWVSSLFEIFYFVFIFILIGKNLSRFSQDLKCFTWFLSSLWSPRIYLGFLTILNPLLFFYLPCNRQEFICTLLELEILFRFYDCLKLRIWKKIRVWVFWRTLYRVIMRCSWKSFCTYRYNR